MAIETGAPLTPITVHGARRLMPKGSLKVHPGEMTIWFHEPIETEGLNDADRGKLIERVRAVMEEALETGPPAAN